MNYKIALLEDDISEEKSTLEMLERFASENNLGFAVDHFESVDSFLSLDFTSYDFFILDIILPGEMDGLEVARKIREKSEDVPLMFITKTAKFAVDSYDVDAIDYVLKPLTYPEFSLKLKKAIKHINSHRPRELIFHLKEGNLYLREDEILYFEIIGHYLHIHTAGETYKTRLTMKSISDMVTDVFAKCSNSFLVNLSHVTEVRTKEVVLGSISLPLTKKYRDSFLEAFGSYIGGVMR